MPLNQADQELLNTHKRKMWIVYIAMIQSLFIYVVVVYVQDRNQDLTPVDISLFFPVLMVVAVSLFLGALLVRYVLFKKMVFKPLKTSEEKVVEHAINRYITLCIVCFALMEAIAIFGLVLFFLSGERLHFFIFLGLSLFGFILVRPSTKEYVGYAEVQKAMLTVNDPTDSQ